MPYRFEHEGNVYLFDKNEEDKDKYVVFSCARNEDDYILEWVEHNLNIGFDKVIIADNNDDSSILPSILSTYIENGTVQIFDCHGLKRFQLYIYDMFLKESNYKWCAYFDCDEFLELSQHASVKDFLSGIKEDCVLINWLVFGGCGNYFKENKPLKERFVEPVYPASTFKENFYVKPIVRAGKSFVAFNNTHSPIPKYISSYNVGGYFHADFQSHVYSPPRYKYAFIRHYYTKSFEEWITNKVRRGWPDEMPDLLKAENYFILENNVQQDIDKCIKGLFVDNNAMDRNKEDLEEKIGKHRVVVLKSTTKNTYSLVLEAFFIMRNFKNKIIVFYGDFIDDSLYSAFLEYGVKTGNDVAYVFNTNEIGNVLSKYNCGNTFYWLDCL